MKSEDKQKKTAKPKTSGPATKIDEKTAEEKLAEERAAKRAANIAARRERLAGIKDRIAKRKAARTDKAKDAAKKAKSGKAVKK